MSFLNALLLGGAAALLAPLLIHLLNRSQFQTVQWGAMHLLDAAVDSNSRRVHWESWLLLLIRCLIPVLLAVTLARPVLTHFQSAGADRNVSLTLLLDNSLSMAAIEQGESLLNRGAGELARIADQSPGAEISLWTTATPVRNLLVEPTTNLARLRAALERAGPAAGSSLPIESLQLGWRQSSSLDPASRQVILASDFQAALWRAASDNELQAVRHQLASDELPIQLFLLPLRTTGTTANLSVHCEDAPPMARVDQSFQWTVRVTNHDRQPAEDVRVTFQVGGQAMASRTLQLPAGASEQVAFACEFTERGWQHLSVRVDDSGSVHGDDVCFHAVQVVAPPKILIIDDCLEVATTTAFNRDRNQLFSGASRYLHLALSPFAEPQRNPFRVTRVRSDELLGEAIVGYDAVIATQLNAATPGLFDSLAAYVDSRGGLLVFASPEIESAGWNTLPDKATGLLPMRFGQVRAATTNEPAKLALANTAFATASWLQSIAAGTESFEFTRWWELVPVEPRAEVQILAKLTSGEPWLAEWNVGSGIVIQCASTCSDDGTNLPSQPAFVPVMLSLAERLVHHATRSAQLAAGQSIAFQVVPVDSARQPVPSRSPPEIDSISTMTVKRIAPADIGESSSVGSALSVELPVPGGLAMFADTRVPGVYAAQLTTDGTSQLAIEPGMFSVNTPELESQLMQLNDAELRSLAARLGATLIESSDDYLQAEKLRRDDWEFWRWLLVGVLGLLFAELLLGLRNSTLSARES